MRMIQQQYIVQQHIVQQPPTISTISNADTSRRNKKEEEDNECCCYCYNTKISKDSRCCGVCYCCFPVKEEEKEKRFDWCPNNFTDYWDSCYVQTTSGYASARDEKNGVCCWFCFFPKLGMFFPCFLGSALPLQLPIAYYL